MYNIEPLDIDTSIQSITDPGLNRLYLRDYGNFYEYQSWYTLINELGLSRNTGGFNWGVGGDLLICIL